MFFKIVAFIQFLLSLILEAEQRFPAGAGAEKKADVMKAATAELRRQGLHGPEDDTQPGNVLELAGHLSDGLVELFNRTNTFKHQRSSSTDAPATPEPEPLPVTPPAPPDPNPPPATTTTEPPPATQPDPSSSSSPPATTPVPETPEK